MKDLFRFLSVPAAVIDLILLLGFSEGIADGSIPLSAGIIGVGVMIIIEVVAFSSFGRKEEEHEENPDE